MFSVCPPLPGGGRYPGQVHMGGTLARQGYSSQVQTGGGYPSQVQMEGGNPARSRWGYPGQVQTGGGYPSQVQMGVPWPGLDEGGTPARSRWGYPGQVQMRGVPQGTPPPEMGYPPSGPGMGYPPPPQLGQQKGVLATRQAVCLLSSRRRNFLFSFFLVAPFQERSDLTG